MTVGQTGGEQLHVLATNELTPHTHSLTSSGSPAGLTVNTANGNNAGSGPLIANLSNGGTNTDPIVVNPAGGDPTTGNPPVSAAGHNTMPPYYVVYFLQRTNRLFYSI